MVTKEEDRGAAGAVSKEGNGSTKVYAQAQSCLISQVINLDLPQGCRPELREQLEVN